MSCFSQVLNNSPEYEGINSAIKKGRLPFGIVGLSLIHKAHIIHSISADNNKKALVITQDEATAVKLSRDLNAFGSNTLFYPSRDFAFNETQAQSREFEQMRLGVLMNMLNGNYDVVVSSVTAAMQRTMPPDELKNRSIILEQGQEVKTQKVIEALLKAGYVRADQVEGTGQFALRGGILDFFPPDSDLPVRVEFWGDTIDTMANFDIETQRRSDNILQIKITPSTEILFDSFEGLAEKIEELANSLRGKKILPAKESLMRDVDSLKNNVRLASLDRYLPIAYETQATLFDYAQNAMLFVSETSAVKEKANAAQKLLNEDIKAAFEDGTLCRGLDNFTISFDDITSIYGKNGAIYLDNFARGSFDTPVKELFNINSQQLSAWSGSISVLMSDLLPPNLKDYTITIMAGTEKAAKTLVEELNDEGVTSIYYDKLPSEFLKGVVNVIGGGLSAGMDYQSLKFMLITQGRAASDQVKIRQKKHKAGNAFTSLDELHTGDYVVHSSHGIGIFDGISKLEVSGLTKDYIKIKYAKQDVLYVPVTQLDLVSKYIGPRDETRVIKLNRIGGKEWEKTRSKVRSAVKDMAKELVELYSQRIKVKGYAFSPDTDMQNDFERRFEFDETDDQLRCIDEIKQDMEKEYPMDRLLCGDVGFGKTEVALRAAFKCIADGKQCAILVPTTILAFQHYQTLMKRFEGFPIEIEMLSRFRTATEQKKIVDNIRRGSIDVVVGTHRLISSDIKFRDLGLLVVDEEQRFGVAQKEKLKEMFPNVDVLTLSATPIPRTLNMAMSGIRDMSIIEEAPQDRHPVQTYVLEYDIGVLIHAIEKELRRGGQVYYMHNKVETISKVAAKLSEFLPDARVGVAHGKMSEDELSDIWRRLLDGEIDILVCTTIIETGVDVPNVNTLIIENADALGLSQLHQIRGRIGRSSRRASAYLTFVRGKELSEIATRRLNAIREYTEFGSGFKIAMRDLELRGAGNILGSQQHGHMEAVGYDMYIKLLSEAVNEEKSEKQEVIPIDKECLVDLQIDAHIPENYIESIPHRLAIYRRIADIRSEEDSQDVIDELIDRFGEPPESVLGLIEVSLLRNTAASIGIYEIGQSGDNLLLYAKEINMQSISRLSQIMRGRILVSAGSKPYISVKIPIAQNPITVLKEALFVLAAHSKNQTQSDEGLINT